MVSTHTTTKNSIEEEFLIKGLLSGLDESVLDTSSTKQNNTIKRANSAPEKSTTSNHYDVDALLEGMDWDWIGLLAQIT